MNHWLTRVGIILGWLLVVAAILYLPHWKLFPRENKSLSVFAWGSTIDLQLLSSFEKETGIKVHVSYYSSNEELLTKLKATDSAGYDLILPSDYAVQIMIEENLLQKLDKKKINFWDNINPLLLHHTYDPQNEYSLPFAFDVYGFGVDKTFFKDRPFDPSWDAIFSAAAIDYKIAMVNDPIDVTSFAAFYLYGRTDNLKPEAFEEIKNLLIEQSRWTTAYTALRGDYFLSTGNCPVVLSINSLIKRTRVNAPHIGFYVPKEGAFITIENFCIPRRSENQAAAYRLLNHLYSLKSVVQNSNVCGLLPPTLDAIAEVELDEYEKDFLVSTTGNLNRFHFIQTLFPAQDILNLWVQVKSF